MAKRRRGTRDRLNAAVAADGDWAVFRLVTEGRTMNEIGAAFGLDRDTIYKWIDEGGDERRASWERAKKQSADCLVEQGMEILDEAQEVTNSAQATVAKGRADYRRWLASVRNREEYGDRPVAEINLNLGELHLQALMAKGHAGHGERSQELIEEADVELIKSSEETDLLGGGRGD